MTPAARQQLSARHIHLHEFFGVNDRANDYAELDLGIEKFKLIPTR